MKPVIALVGRPNVGKSTLFNRLTRTRDALVADFPGLTRDRKYGDGRMGDYPYTVVDTGGIGENEDGIDAPMTDQSLRAVGEADLVLFMVDGRAGLTAADEQIAADNAEGFHKPYAADRGGVAPEAWHISYRPGADSYLSEIAAERLLPLWRGEPDPLGNMHEPLTMLHVVEPRIEALLNQYVSTQ